ncbi:MAG: hypothetical protein JWP31_383 [Aeromicrobium sp.]|nr:hypothetical protein [Aeromicrobium sp.]
MPRPFTKKTFRDKLEAQLSDLASQTEDLRHQLVEQTGELRKQVAERAPGVREQLVAALPDKDQLLDLRDDLFERLPDTVQDRLPEKVKPKRARLRKVAAVGVLTGAGAAAFAILKRKGATSEAYTPPTMPTPPPPSPTTPAATPTTVSPTTAGDVIGDGFGDSPARPGKKADGKKF